MMTDEIYCQWCDHAKSEHNGKDTKKTYERGYCTNSGCRCNHFGEPSYRCPKCGQTSDGGFSGLVAITAYADISGSGDLGDHDGWNIKGQRWLTFKCDGCEFEVEDEGGNSDSQFAQAALTKPNHLEEEEE